MKMKVFCVSFISLESELESLRDALLKARLDTTPPKSKSRSPGIKLCFPFDKKKQNKGYNFNASQS